jgi:hypothetical protein
MYDGTWDKAPTMGWIGVQVHPQRTNDPRAGLEPLCEHLDLYERMLAQSFASGAALRFNALRLYDTEETKRLVKKWVDWAKEYREILTSDIIHVRRPDGRDIDCILHVNPQLDIKGPAMVFNPMDAPLNRMLRLPLYYTGLKKAAMVRIEDGPEKEFALDANARVEIPISVSPQGFTWLTVQ